MPIPAPIKAHNISMTPPPNKKVKDPQASAAASAKAPGENLSAFFNVIETAY